MFPTTTKPEFQLVGPALARRVRPLVRVPLIGIGGITPDNAQPLMDTIDRNGTIWISWPKKAAKVETDITEDVIRDVVLPIGLVDVKVAAVDEVWSGLKLVIRKELR